MDDKKTFCECEIDGKRVPYDAARTANVPLEEAKKSHEHFDYIGMGNKIWVDGIYQRGFENEMCYFFKYKQTA